MKMRIVFGEVARNMLINKQGGNMAKSKPKVESPYKSAGLDSKESRGVKRKKPEKDWLSRGGGSIKATREITNKSLGI